MDGKKWKIVGLEQALDSVPESERAALTAEIESAFTDFDPDDPPGERVIEVAPNTRTCPRCAGALEELGLVPDPASTTTRHVILECEACDAMFCERHEEQ
ncbi:MAG: hypothetical protein KIT84_17065 [Labilithrix sp.]|nr:hypothetical protein [Labilithrix sp.]MCW5812741.1 hypothetical protein [Labilithrix sp.]